MLINIFTLRFQFISEQSLTQQTHKNCYLHVAYCVFIAEEFLILSLTLVDKLKNNLNIKGHERLLQNIFSTADYVCVLLGQDTFLKRQTNKQQISGMTSV